MTIKTREPDDRFKAQVPDFKLEKRERRRYRTWRDDPDVDEAATTMATEAETTSKPVEEPIAKPEQTQSKPKAEVAEEFLDSAAVEIIEPQANPKQSLGEDISLLGSGSFVGPKEHEAKGKQTQSKTVEEPIAKPEQTPSKPKADEKPSRVKPQAEPQAIGEQTDSKPAAIGKQTQSNQSFASLTGLQRDLILFYYECIQFNGGQNTGPITLERLMELTARDGNTLKDANQRLMKKGLLLRDDFKNGRGGWVVYSLPNHVRESVYRMLMVSKPQANLKQSSSKPIEHPQAQPQAEPSSSSFGSYYSESESEKNEPHSTQPTTTTGSGAAEKDYSWISKIDIPTELKQYISESHLRQLVRHGFTSGEQDIVQTSLDNLAYAIAIGYQYKSPVGLFLKAMKNDGFVSPVENPEFNRERARRLMKADKARVEEAVQQEILRIALEKESESNSYRKSLDDIPY
jgi:hypothetical protein